MGDALDFDWDDDNEAEVAGHGIAPEEAEEVLTNNPVPLRRYLRRGERRTMVVGRTDAGSPLVFVYTMRHGMIRVVTAYPAEPEDIRRLRQ